ncbi:MAG: aspartyl/asparaginyl beta-hydroxylase domain-containing protein [Pseudomonadales bacterium]|nr:aspartyl/asparaginyl beta-hydroxylase domain-containing protein [Pseudomonadales bacterium]
MNIAELENQLQAEFQAGRFQQAESLSRELLSCKPESIPGLQVAWRAAVRRGQFGDALSHLDKLANLLPDNIQIFGSLGMVAFECGEFSRARKALAQVLRFNPASIQDLIYHGLSCERLGEDHQAAGSFLRAQRLVEHAQGQGLPAKVLSLMDHASEFVRHRLASVIAEQLQPLKAQYGDQALARIQASADIFTGHRPAKFAHPKLYPGLAYIPDMPVRLFYEREEFSWITRLENATDDIREELLQLLQADGNFKPYIDHPDGSKKAQDWQELNHSMDWTSFHFYRHGERLEENCARCPKTSAVLASLDLHRVPGYSPEVMFSVLRPHSRIPPHTGTINGRLIVHLPLIVPENCGALGVVDEQRGWREGECLIFDDAFEHEAWNDSDETRVVLILDTWNPDLSQAEREAFTRMLHSARTFERELLVQQPV